VPPFMGFFESTAQPLPGWAGGDGGSNPTGGCAFIDFVLSAAGQAILANYGFSKI
jgi:hypothetical protein